MRKYRLLPAVFALAIVMLTGCKDPVGVPGDVHTSNWYTTDCPAFFISPTGHLDRNEGPPDYFYWNYGTITVRYTDDGYGKDNPRANGVCFFKIPPFNCSGAVPKCTLFYYQNSHTDAGEGEPFLFNAWNANVEWPPSQYADRAVAWWAISNSTCTLAVDAIHESDGWQAVPLDTPACAAIGDSGAWYYQYDPDGWASFKTGWAYHGSVDGARTDIAGYDDVLGRKPHIKVVYDGP